VENVPKYLGRLIVVVLAVAALAYLIVNGVPGFSTPSPQSSSVPAASQGGSPGNGGPTGESGQPAAPPLAGTSTGTGIPKKPAPKPSPVVLTVIVDDSAQPGDVTSAPKGITACRSRCTASFPSGATVVLTVTSHGGGIFSLWTGQGCDFADRELCTVTMTSNRTVTITLSSGSPG